MTRNLGEYPIKKRTVTDFKTEKTSEYLLQNFQEVPVRTTECHH